MLDLTPEQLLTTTRAVRKRLDLSRPVERAVIEDCLETAVQAPTGSNSQGWHFVVVDDPEKKRALADLYGAAFDAYVSGARTDYGPDDPRTLRMGAVTESATWLRQHLHEVPVLLIPCGEGRMPENGLPVLIQASWWGSILPAVWSFMLAARLRGLGTAWTTLHLASEKQAADLLGIPYDKVTQAGLIPVAYAAGEFKPASRLPVRGLVHWNRW